MSCVLFEYVCVCGVLEVLSPHSFAVGDTSQLQPYAHGGFVVLTKTPKTYRFVSWPLAARGEMILSIQFLMSIIAVFQETLEKQLCDPRILTPDLSKPEVRTSMSPNTREKWLAFLMQHTKRHLFKSIPPGPTTNPCCHVGTGRIPGTAQPTSQHWVKRLNINFPWLC